VVVALHRPTGHDHVVTDREGRYRYLGVRAGRTGIGLWRDDDEVDIGRPVALLVEPGETYTVDLQVLARMPK
jgi:hypothetical protein